MRVCILVFFFFFVVHPSQRLIMFHYNGPDCNADPAACPSGLNYYYQYASDNNDRTFSSPASIEDRANSCAVNNKNTFVGLANFVTPSDWNEVDRRNAINHAERLNAYYATKDYVDSCSSILGTDINFVLNDWWGEGELIRFTQDHNSARAIGNSYDPPTPMPTMSYITTKEPTLFPTFFPTEPDATAVPTVSPEPSSSPTATPTGRPDPCPDLNGNCKACKKESDNCLWCVSSATCYNRFIFEDIFDMDDEIIPCQGEDVIYSFDTTCTANSKPQVSVYDDEYASNDDDIIDSNETVTEIDDTYEIDEIDESASPTRAPAEPPTLPPFFVPLSPPTAIAATSNVFSNIFGKDTTSGASSNSFTSYVTSGLSIMLLLLLLTA